MNYVLFDIKKGKLNNNKILHTAILKNLNIKIIHL